MFWCNSFINLSVKCILLYSTFEKKKGTLFCVSEYNKPLFPCFAHAAGSFKPLIQVQISSNITLNFGELGQHLTSSLTQLKARTHLSFVLHILNLLCVNSSFTVCGYLSWDWVCPGLLCLGKRLLKEIPGQITGLRFLICDHSGDVTRSVSGSVVWGGQRREEATAGFLQLCSICFVTSSRAQTSSLSTSNLF